MKKSIGEAVIAGFPMYLYRTKVSDEDALATLPADANAEAKSKLLLSLILSREEFDPKTSPKPGRLSLADVNALPPPDLEAAVQFVIDKRQILFKRQEDDQPIPEPAQDSLIGWLSRIIDWRVAQTKRNKAKLYEGISQSWKSLSDWANQAEARHERIIQNSPPLHDYLTDAANRHAADRGRELANSDATAEASARAAASLEELSGNLIKFVQLFTTARVEQERENRRSIKIAIATFFASLIVSALGAYFAAASYQQDSENNQSNDKWQDEVKALLQQSAQREETEGTLRAEIRHLRQQIDVAEDEIRRAQRQPVPEKQPRSAKQ